MNKDVYHDIRIEYDDGFAFLKWSLINFDTRCARPATWWLIMCYFEIDLDEIYSFVLVKASSIVSFKRLMN